MRFAASKRPKKAACLMTKRHFQLPQIAAVIALAILVAIGMWKTADRGGVSKEVFISYPEAIMGTRSKLVAIAQNPSEALASMAEAEAALRAVESRMSHRIASSEVAQFNASGVGDDVLLSPDTIEVLRAARSSVEQTGGAFDVTCRPIIEQWRRAAEQDRLPAGDDLAAARASSTWSMIELTKSGAVKTAASMQVDLGGIAKGYAIDKAVAAMQLSGALAGLVEVGGDLRCFGAPPKGSHWIVDVRNPFEEGVLTHLRLKEKAICTSGNYARFSEIEGKRYSHIIDPRTARPADVAPSVTVVANTALEADIWATALSVLGEAGLDMLPDTVEALLVEGTPERYTLVATAGLVQRMPQPLPVELAIHGQAQAWSKASP